MSRTRTVILSAVAAVLLVAAVAYGAGTTTAHHGSDHLTGSGASVDDSVFAAALGADGQDGPADDDRPGMGRGMMGMRHGPMLGMGQWLLHGEGVVKDRDGNYVTVATQSGEVTAVDATSVTVKSEDGYSRTWALTDATKYWSFPNDATKAHLKVGVDVRVAGTVTDGKATARLIWFPPKAGTMPKPGTMPMHPHQPKPGDSRSPQPSASASTSSSSTTA